MTRSADGPRGEDAAELARSLREQYETLDRHSRTQRELIDADRIEDLLSVLKDRQGVISEIERLSAEVSRIGRSALPDAQRAAFESELDVVEQLARAVAERDERDRTELDARRGKVASQLGGIGTKQAAVRAYGGGGARAGARFQDGRA